MPQEVVKLRRFTTSGGIIGNRVRRSHRTNDVRRTKPAASDAHTGVEVQECDEDSMSPKIRASRPAPLVRTPGTSTGRVSGFRDSATTVTVRAIPATPKGTLTQKI